MSRDDWFDEGWEGDAVYGAERRRSSGEHRRAGRDGRQPGSRDEWEERSAEQPHRQDGVHWAERSPIPGGVSSGPVGSYAGEWRRIGERPDVHTYGRRRGATTGEGGRRLMPAGYVLLAIIVALVLGALLNADGLRRMASDQPVGAKRDLLMAVTRPLAAVGSTLRLDELGALVDRALGRDVSSEEEGVHRRATPHATPRESRSPSPGASRPPAIVVPTEDAPLILWVGGDSMAMVFGESLVAMSERTDVIDSTLDYRVSSGLSRPDFYNWPKRLRAEMKGLDPDVAVAVFGANDGQNVEYQGRVLQFGSPEWVALYHQRVGAAMDILIGGARHRQVWWIGMPICRDPEQSSVYRKLNVVYSAEAEKRPEVRYIDTYTMFSDANGRYSDYLPGLSGDTELMRQGDGIHWSRAGGDLAADAVLDQIRKRWHIK